jgi:hypothetical protein
MSRGLPKKLLSHRHFSARPGKAVKFYTEVMGWSLIMQPTDVVEGDSSDSKMCTDVFGAGWGSFRIAYESPYVGII